MRNQSEMIWELPQHGSHNESILRRAGDGKQAESRVVVQFDVEAASRRHLAS